MSIIQVLRAFWGWQSGSLSSSKLLTAAEVRKTGGGKARTPHHKITAYTGIQQIRNSARASTDACFYPLSPMLCLLYVPLIALAGIQVLGL